MKISRACQWVSACDRKRPFVAIQRWKDGRANFVWRDTFEATYSVVVDADASAMKAQVVVGAKSLAQFARAVGGAVSFSSTNGRGLTVHGDFGNALLHGHELEIGEDDWMEARYRIGSLEDGRWREIVQTCGAAVSKDDMRRGLWCYRLEPVAVVATDTHRMHLAPGVDECAVASVHSVAAAVAAEVGGGE